MPNLPALPKGASNKDKAKLLALLTPDSIEATAAVLEVSPAEALEFVEQHDAEISAEHQRLELTGGALSVMARRYAVRAIQRFNDDFDQLDTMEVADLLKHALRIIENDDRVKLAEKDPTAHLPVAHIVINIMGADAMPATAPRTIDAETVEVLG